MDEKTKREYIESCIDDFLEAKKKSMCELTTQDIIELCGEFLDTVIFKDMTHIGVEGVFSWKLGCVLTDCIGAGKQGESEMTRVRHNLDEFLAFSEKFFGLRYEDGLMVESKERRNRYEV